MTVWEEYQGNVTVRGRWLPPLLLSLFLHLCLLRVLVPAQETMPPRIIGSQTMTVILASPAPAVSAPAARLTESQSQPMAAKPVPPATQTEPVPHREITASSPLRLLPGKVKKSLQHETAQAVQPSSAAAATMITSAPAAAAPQGGTTETSPIGAAEAPATQAAVQAAVPLATDNRPPEYPTLARKRGWEGKVVLTVAVGSDGTPQSVQVESGSGHELLDEAALRAVRTWRFQPGSRSGEPVASQVQVPVHFLLQDNS